jgi:hypothetical protein
MEKPVFVTASRRRGSPFSCHGESIARGHPDSVLFLTGSPHASRVRDDTRTNKKREFNDAQDKINIRVFELSNPLSRFP